MKKHVFIINPVAGKGTVQQTLIQKIHGYFQDRDDFEIIISHRKFEIIDIARQKGREGAALFACGGDGTFNEAVNGADLGKCTVTPVPCGSGNDFVKNFSGTESFLNIERLVCGQEEKIDLFCCNGRLVANSCNIGFDARVCEGTMHYKNMPLVTGHGAYLLSVFSNLAGGIAQDFEVAFDDEEVKKGDILLVLAANGMVCGGGFYGAPLARINDGLMDVCLFDRVSRIKFLSLMDQYKKGSHVGNPAFDEFMVYRKTRSLRVSSPKEIVLACDGECERVGGVEITVKEEMLNMLLPKGCEILSGKKANPIR